MEDENTKYRVELFIYDLSQGLASVMSQMLIGRQLDGIWHTSVVVYGREFFFGSSGIQCCVPVSARISLDRFLCFLHFWQSKFNRVFFLGLVFVVYISNHISFIHFSQLSLIFIYCAYFAFACCVCVKFRQYSFVRGDAVAQHRSRRSRTTTLCGKFEATKMRHFHLKIATIMHQPSRAFFVWSPSNSMLNIYIWILTHTYILTLRNG